MVNALYRGEVSRDGDSVSLRTAAPLTARAAGAAATAASQGLFDAITAGLVSPRDARAIMERAAQVEAARITLKRETGMFFVQPYLLPRKPPAELRRMGYGDEDIRTLYAAQPAHDRDEAQAGWSDEDRDA